MTASQYLQAIADAPTMEDANLILRKVQAEVASRRLTVADYIKANSAFYARWGDDCRQASARLADMSYRRGNWTGD